MSKTFHDDLYLGRHSTAVIGILFGNGDGALMLSVNEAKQLGDDTWALVHTPYYGDDVGVIVLAKKNGKLVFSKIDRQSDSYMVGDVAYAGQRLGLVTIVVPDWHAPVADEDAALAKAFKIFVADCGWRPHIETIHRLHVLVVYAHGSVAKYGRMETMYAEEIDKFLAGGPAPRLIEHRPALPRLGS